MKPATANNGKPRKKIHFVLFMAIVGAVFALLIWLSLSISRGIAGHKNQKDSVLKQAFNMRLPDAQVPDKKKTKFEIYQEAEQDSIRRKQLSDSDPYQAKDYDPAPPEGSPFIDGSPAATPPVKESEARRSGQGKSHDPNEKKINEKLEALKALVNTPSVPEPGMAGYAAGGGMQVSPGQMPGTGGAAGANAAAIAQLERMMEQAQVKETVPDGEMQQLSEVLGRLADVQDPEAAKLRRQVNKAQAELPLRVGMKPPVAGVDALLSLPVSVPAENGFYGISDVPDTIASAGDAIPCVVHETQTLYNGSTVKLRTLQDIWVGTVRIPKGTFVFGRCGIADERLLIQLNRVTYKNQLYNVDMQVYDATDGQEGLSVPGALTDNTVRDGVDRMTQALAVGTVVDGSIGAQAANAGIQSVTGLLSKKVRNVRVTARAGHVLLLKNGRN